MANHPKFPIDIRSTLIELCRRILLLLFVVLIAVAITHRLWNPEDMRNASFVLGTSLLTLLSLYLHVTDPR